MINKVYLEKFIWIKMPYNETTVVLGGLMHIPVLIVVLRFVENRFKRNEIEFKN